jgi:L-malate glycosyltransferase
VCHLASADLWAGAEVQLATLLSWLVKVPDLEISTVLLNEGRLARELRSAGFRPHVIPESRHSSWTIARRLSAYFAQHAVDILHTHKYKENVLAVLAPACRAVRRRVRTIHGLPEPFHGFRAVKMGAYQALDNIVNRWAVDRILAVSRDMTTQLMQGFGSPRVTCIHNGIDIVPTRSTERSAALRAELNLSCGDVLVGTMGRLAPVKGLESFLRAAVVISRERPNVKFVVAGEGPDEGSLRALARDLGLDGVRFLGHRDDGHDVLAAMDIFVLPSLSEGIPMVLLEALALGRPVVASRAGGIPEVVEHGVSGLLVTPGCHDEIAHSCMTLMDDESFARTLGGAGRRRVEQEFCADTMAARVADVYRALM